MAYSIEDATAFYDAAKQGYLAALKMSEYSIKERSAKRAAIDKLREEMDRWKRIIDTNTETGTTQGSIKVNRFVPRD
jgi:hypothetical protein